jgi:hypothetical protein
MAHDSGMIPGEPGGVAGLPVDDATGPFVAQKGSAPKAD